MKRGSDSIIHIDMAQNLKLKSVVTIFLVSFLFHSYLYFLAPGDLAIPLLVSIFSFVVLLYVTKNFFLSILLLIITTYQYMFPSKNYQFIIASPLEYRNDVLSNGYIEYIAITLSDIYTFLILPLLINKTVTAIKSGKNYFSKAIAYWYLLPWIIFIIFSLNSSLNISSFPEFSLNVTLHYFKFILVFIGLFIALFENSTSRKHIMVTVSASLFWQLTLGVLQLLLNFTSRGSSQNPNPVDIEENTGLPRIFGISYHPNQHAFFIICLSLLFFSHKWKNKKTTILVFILAAVNIAATQSRTIIIVSIVILCLELFLTKKTRIINFCKNNFQIILYLLPLFLFTSFIIFQRFRNIELTTGEYGGLTLRKKMFFDSLELIQTTPLFGVGPGVIVRALLDNIPMGYIYEFPQPVHSAYLQLALESGALAAFCFFFPLLYFICVKIKTQRTKILTSNDRMYLYCILAILVYYLVQPAWGRTEFYVISLVTVLSINRSTVSPTLPKQ